MLYAPNNVVEVKHPLLQHKLSLMRDKKTRSVIFRALMKEAGMTPMQIIVAATKNGAEMIGRVEHLGTVEAGKLADIIVVNGHPLKNISDLGNVELVIQNGTFIDPKMLSFRQMP